MSGWLLTGLPGTGIHPLRRYVGSDMDSRRTGAGNISQLAVRRQKTEEIHAGGRQCADAAGFFREPFSR